MTREDSVTIQFHREKHTNATYIKQTNGCQTDKFYIIFLHIFIT